MRAAQKSDASTITKSTAQIIRENFFTLFNFLNFGIALLLFAVHAYSNMLFIGIVILNIMIGTVQALKAKRLVDQLSILNKPVIHILENGSEKDIPLEDVKKGDQMLLRSGDQICSDAVITKGCIEVNEALLTGESDAVLKNAGQELYSGSFVMSGRALATVTHTGDENYATQLVSQVKRQKQLHSELLDSMKKVTHFTSFLILPLGIALFAEAILLRSASADSAVVQSAAALLGMLPKGLVLLISVSLAAGVIRLSKKQILVQNIYALETLAHVDTICLDKTGTLTDGKLHVSGLYPMSGFSREEIGRLLGTYLKFSEDQNATSSALSSTFSFRNPIETCSGTIPFSSARKWGSVSFEGGGSVFVGAPDVLFGVIPEEMKAELETGHRLLGAAYLEQEWNDRGTLPDNLIPICCITLEDNIRPSARETLQFFQKEGVCVKIISGDYGETVSRLAKRAGLSKWQDVIDLSALPEPIDYDMICTAYSIFARVTPKQKEALVRALKRQGHCVAMTGDGVNDLLALREADCSIAVADGSSASRQLAQIVLMNSDFSALPDVVMEGRRVIHNVTRTSGVFFIKTIYSVLVSLLCLIANIPFPFIPIQITLVDACVEAFPSFLTMLEADTRPVAGKFLATAFRNAAPFGLSITAVILFTSLFSPFAEAQQQTVMYLLLILISMAAVMKSCQPFTLFRGLICAAMAIGIATALLLFPGLLELTSLTAPMTRFILLTGVCILLLLWLLMSQKHKKQSTCGNQHYAQC
ncbi:MAG: HAD-IC family P-type ATPase [Eubacteriales bacterium]|nr:HAD-IC family P-type ATPase [Eubacteriales bacterium]